MVLQPKAAKYPKSENSTQIFSTFVNQVLMGKKESGRQK